MNSKHFRFLGGLLLAFSVCAQAREHEETSGRRERRNSDERRNERGRALYRRNWTIILDALERCGMRENSAAVRIARNHLRAASRGEKEHRLHEKKRDERKHREL